MTYIDVQLRDVAVGDAVMVDGYQSRVTSVTHDRAARWVIVEVVDIQTGEQATVEGVPGDTIEYLAHNEQEPPR